MLLVKFGAFIPEAPSIYKASISDIDASTSGRLEKGKMQRDRIRGGDNPVHKLTLGWEKLTDEQMQSIIEAVKGETTQTGFYFGEWIEKEMYAGDREIVLESDSDGCRWQVNLNMVEV